jgi:hypothetical protein
LSNILKQYSNLLVDREEYLMHTISCKIKTDFISQLREYIKQGKFPIKIGMYKKSLTYKIRRKQMLATLPQ